MIDIPVEDFMFVVCLLVGGGLLLITVLVDDILGAVFDFDVGGVSLMPLLLSFVSMFGVGGLFATQVLDLHGGQAAAVGAASASSAWASPGSSSAHSVGQRRPSPSRRAISWDTTPTSRSASRPVATAACSSRPRARPTNSRLQPRPTSRRAPSPE